MARRDGRTRTVRMHYTNCFASVRLATCLSGNSSSVFVMDLVRKGRH